MRLRLHWDCDQILIQESFNLLTLIKLAFEHSFNYLSYLSFLATLTAFLSCWYTKSYPSSQLANVRFGARRDATLDLVGYLLRWSYARFLSYYTRFLAYLPKLVHPPLPSHLGLLKALALSSDRARALKRLAEGKQKKKEEDRGRNLTIPLSLGLKRSCPIPIGSGSQKSYPFQLSAQESLNQRAYKEGSQKAGKGTKAEKEIWDFDGFEGIS